MSSGNAKIGQPAPDFNATAVVKGQFENIKLGDYKGNCGGCFYIGFYEEVFEKALLCSEFPLVANASLKHQLGRRPMLWQLLIWCLYILQGSIWSSSSTPWTSRSCVPLRSLLSATGWRNSAVLAARLLAAPLTPNSVTWHGKKMEGILLRCLWLQLVTNSWHLFDSCCFC